MSIASGHASFHLSDADPESPRWLDDERASGLPPLEFGLMKYRPGEAPGASPAETMYWHEDVLISLTLVVDGAAITKAVQWGISQGRTNF